MIILGIDPGLSGAIAALRTDADPTALPELLYVHDMPTMEFKSSSKRNKRQINMALLGNLLCPPHLPPPDRAVVELVGAMPGQGVTSMFNFGYSTGAIHGALGALQIPTDTIRPQRWRALTRTPTGKSGSRHRVSQLFPAQADMFARARDDGRAEAVLIALGHHAELLKLSR